MLFLEQNNLNSLNWQNLYSICARASNIILNNLFLRSLNTSAQIYDNSLIATTFEFLNSNNEEYFYETAAHAYVFSNGLKRRARGLSDSAFGLLVIVISYILFRKGERWACTVSCLFLFSS